MNTIKKIAGEAFYIFKKYPRTALPLLIMGILDFVALYLLYLAPQRPVSVLLAPPVRAFWGEQFLHYPMNLFLLPKLYHWRVDDWLCRCHDSRCAHEKDTELLL